MIILVTTCNLQANQICPPPLSSISDGIIAEFRMHGHPNRFRTILASRRWKVSQRNKHMTIEYDRRIWSSNMIEHDRMHIADDSSDRPPWSACEQWNALKIEIVFNDQINYAGNNWYIQIIGPLRLEKFVHQAKRNSIGWDIQPFRYSTVCWVISTVKFNDECPEKHAAQPHCQPHRPMPLGAQVGKQPTRDLRSILFEQKTPPNSRRTHAKLRHHLTQTSSCSNTIQLRHRPSLRPKRPNAQLIKAHRQLFTFFACLLCHSRAVRLSTHLSQRWVSKTLTD